MRYIQKIWYSGLHIGDVFDLPVVKAVIKTADNEPVVILRPDMMANGKQNVLLTGQCLCQDESQLWHVNDDNENENV